MSECIISDNAQRGILRSINHNKYTKLYYQGQFIKLGMLGAIKKSYKGRKLNMKFKMNDIKPNDKQNEGYIPNAKEILGEEMFNKFCEQIKELDKQTLKKSIELLESLTDYICSNNHVFLENAYLDAKDIILNELKD